MSKVLDLDLDEIICKLEGGQPSLETIEGLIYSRKEKTIYTILDLFRREEIRGDYYVMDELCDAFDLYTQNDLDRYYLDHADNALLPALETILEWGKSLGADPQDLRCDLAAQHPTLADKIKEIEMRKL